MADEYDVLYTRPDVESLGGTNTRAVQVVGARTKPHGVVFELRAPATQSTPDEIAGGLLSLAVTFEGFFAFAGVADVSWYEKVTDAQQLEDRALLYITSSTGYSSNVIDLPYYDWTDEFVGPAVAAMRAYLDKLEAL